MQKLMRKRVTAIKTVVISNVIITIVIQKNNCENISSNKCSVTVTAQNKKEIKNKIQKEKIIEIEEDIEFDIMTYINKICRGKFVIN